MRIAVVHSFYSSKQPSGENVMVEAQVTALRNAGHDVELVARRTDDVKGRPLAPARLAISVATGIGYDPTPLLHEFRPDVVHVHNLFPNFGTHWLSKWEGPLVATVHNFRPLCAKGTLVRDGALCTACPDGRSANAVKHRCYRDSRLATLPLAIRNARGVDHDPLLRRADRIVALSDVSISMYSRWTDTRDRWTVVPNFVADGPFSLARPETPTWVFAGRLSEEKGIQQLLSVWPRDIALEIIGDGPLRGEVAKSANERVRLIGPMGRSALRSRLPGYTGLVFPSHWPEGVPLVVGEALAAGLPIVATTGTAVEPEIREHAVGRVVPLPLKASDLAEALTGVDAEPALRARARTRFLEAYSGPAWLTAMSHIYEQVQS